MKQEEIDAKVFDFIDKAIHAVRYMKMVRLCDSGTRLFEAAVWVDGEGVVFVQKYKYHAQAVAACDEFVYDMIRDSRFGSRPFICVKESE